LNSNQEKSVFNFEVFDIKLDTEYLGRNFIYSDEVESTNSLLLEKQNKYNTNGTVLLAEKQSKGRGRKDRTWYSTKGQNLTFSVLINSKKLLKYNPNYINFASALAVGSAIENRYGLRADMKWPNDVLVNGKKISGILLESSSAGSTLERLVVGVGINVNQAVFQGQFKIDPTSIQLETGVNADREIMLAEFLNIFEAVLNKIENNPEEIINEWRNRCRMIGERITIEEDGKIRTGIFDDIDNNGYLLFRSGGKIETIHFGDVSVI
jgi:BirA family transcriptional regulator, biotin operon repressor / biotin---[acetyl-CoA-carboxylase] ligase